MVLAPSARDFLVRFLFFFISLARTIPGGGGDLGAGQVRLSFLRSRPYMVVPWRVSTVLFYLWFNPHTGTGLLPSGQRCVAWRAKVRPRTGRGALLWGHFLVRMVLSKSRYVAVRLPWRAGRAVCFRREGADVSVAGVAARQILFSVSQ